MVLHQAIRAARAGDLHALRELASRGLLSPAVDAQGAGPVHHAARCGRLECLRFLVSEHGLPPDARAANGATPVHDAAATGHVRELRWLLEEAGCSVEDRDAAGATALHLAARFGCAEAVRWLLSVGGPAMEEAETECGAVAAHYAAFNGHLDCVELLVGHAPRCVNRQMSTGTTALYLACQEGHVNVAEYLVKRCEADVHVRAHDGMTCLHAASHMGHIRVVTWLLTHTEVNPSCQDGDGATALHFAASRGHSRVLERLLGAGAKILKDLWGGTPLHDAAENGEMECCERLLASHADPSDRDMDGFTPTQLAHYNGHHLCAKYLRSHENLVIAVPSTQEDVMKTAVTVMDTLKQPESEETVAARYPRPSMSIIPRIEKIQTATSVIQGLHRPKRTPPDANKLLADRKLLGDMKPIVSLKQSSLSGVFTGQASKMVVLPTEEANLADMDYLVPSHDEKGRPIAEWKRQVMVRQLQARLLDEEDQRLKENGRSLSKVNWCYSQAHNAILGPSGELLTEHDLAYLEQQIASLTRRPPLFRSYFNAKNTVLYSGQYGILLFRLHRQQALYSPEQFLPRMDGVPLEYDKLTLDLFMLGYFHILELDLPVDERKMRHLLCFEVFDHVGSFPWELVRDFHKAVLQDIAAGDREWKDGFEDLKLKFFGGATAGRERVTAEAEAETEAETHQLPEIRPLPKVIVQTPTPDEGSLYVGTDISCFSNEEICQYIDRSFAFWKEKEAEIFDFE
ncbi:espin-like protein [Hippocampus comes]|uniref:espin-like protein n=1 Tax=Hippocampus comes TaxID=109280 RepID=UPI00094EF58B|nr:PREDICTED: espin-like protein [Hippocampus comes]